MFRNYMTPYPYYKNYYHVPYRYYYGYYPVPFSNYINSNFAQTNQDIFNSGTMTDVIQQSIISQTPNEDGETGICTQ